MANGAGSALPKASPPGAQPSPSVPDQTQIHPLTLEDRIRARAHEIWLSHNGQGGSGEADWLQAEEEILNEIKK